MTTPSRRLIICFDGTDNTPKNGTNVFITHQAVAKVDENGVKQYSLYIDGVGSNFIDIPGKAFGFGIAKKIKEAYEWLIKKYIDDAEIFVFGFSRGAFAARSLIQMLNNCGLMRPDTLKAISIDEMFERYEKITEQMTEQVYPIYRLRYFDKQDTPQKNLPENWSRVKEENKLFLNNDTIVQFKRKGEGGIKFAGLWDTVGSLGLTMYSKKDDYSGKTTSFSASSHNVRLPNCLKSAYHAVAIDEYRSTFETTLWRKFYTKDAFNNPERINEFPLADFEQRWFIGAHTDVGGAGVSNDGNKLWYLPLKWILDKAVEHRLCLENKPTVNNNAHLSDIYNSYLRTLAGFPEWLKDKATPGDQRNHRVIGRVPKEVSTQAGEVGMLCTINETIDPTVFDRLSKIAEYRPQNLITYLVNNPSIIPDNQLTSKILAKEAWNNTGVLLIKGHEYSIDLVDNLTEQLKDASHIPSSIEGENWQGFWFRLFSKLKRKPDEKWFALIGSVDKKHEWAIKNHSKFTAPETGTLQCYFNDATGFYWNNSGSVVLKVQRIG